MSAVPGGAFSITNFGSFGSIFVAPVIDQPQAPVVTFDHRFTARAKSVLESWSEEVL